MHCKRFEKLLINLPQIIKMAVLPIQKYFSLNGNLTRCEQFVAAENEGGVYEVVRIIDGIPLFLEEHLDRFFRSAGLAGINITFSAKQLTGFVSSLIEANKVNEGNILLSVKITLKIFFIQHSYPDEKMYREGVNCGLLHAERINPNAKVFQTKVRARANNLIQKQGFYEVLLVDRSGLITEGSRSNVFFIRENSLITPPSGQVLLGITRQKTIRCAEILGLNWEEKEIELTELADFDAAFITGTSPKILPVSQIAELSFSVSNGILRELITQFDLLIEEYLFSQRR